METPGKLSLNDQIRRARKNFAAMAATYSLGAFNDNFFKQAVMMTAVATGRPQYQGYALMIFTLPYILLAAPAGWAADRYPKRTVVIASKFMELAAMLFGAAGIITGHWSLIFAMLATMGTQATVFSPSLNGAIPELYPAAYVTRANSFIKIAVTAAILAGTSLAGIALDWPGVGPFGYEMGRWTVAAVIVAVALLGVAGSFGVPRRAAAAPGTPFPWSGPIDTLRTLRETGKDKLLAITIAANSFFWFIASLQLLLINTLGIDQLKFSKTITSYLVGAELVGMAIGGLVIGKISRGRRWYGVLWPSTFILGLLMIGVGLVPLLPAHARVAVLFSVLAAMGVSGGFFLVPAESFIQVRPDPDRKGAVIAAANFGAFSGIILSSLVSMLLNRPIPDAPGSLIVHPLVVPTLGFAITGVATIALSVWLAIIWYSSVSRRPPMVHRVIRWIR